MKTFFISISFIMFFISCKKETKDVELKESLTVFAASSLKEVLTEISIELKKKGGENIRFSFEGSSILAKQIQEGAKADLFFSAAPEWVESVKPLNKKDWLGNELVLVVRKDVQEVDLKNLKSLALANQQVPAGKYAVAALKNLGVSLPERVIYGNNVRDVLSKVSHGGAEAGVVYATDVLLDAEVKVNFRFPLESHPQIIYTIGLLTKDGEKLFKIFQEPWVTEIAKKHGFIVLE